MKTIVSVLIFVALLATVVNTTEAGYVLAKHIDKDGFVYMVIDEGESGTFFCTKIEPFLKINKNKGAARRAAEDMLELKLQEIMRRNLSIFVTSGSKYALIKLEHAVRMNERFSIEDLLEKMEEKE